MLVDELIEVLVSSVEKHGEQPLTNRWLLNIIRMAARNYESEYEERRGYLGMDDIM